MPWRRKGVSFSVREMSGLQSHNTCEEITTEEDPSQQVQSSSSDNSNDDIESAKENKNAMEAPTSRMSDMAAANRKQIASLSSEVSSLRTDLLVVEVLFTD